MRSAFYISLVVFVIGGTSLAEAATPSEDLARSIAELGGQACYDVVRGTIPMPAVGEPNAVDQSIEAVEGMGLGYGINDGMMSGLGKPAISMISRAILGSKSFEQGDVILAVGGGQQSCRVILLSEPSVDVTEAVSAHLMRSHWEAVPSATRTRGAFERRAFVRRDSKGSPYLMNLITATTPVPGSKLRMFTVTIRIPDHIQVPDGL